MSQQTIKYLAGGFLYGLWAALVFTGKADAQHLEIALGAGISALMGFNGIYQAVTKLQAVEPGPLKQAGPQE